MHQGQHITTSRRAGFTLVELLVVILIIAILAGLSWAVLGRTGTTARVAATRTTLQQLDSLLAERIEAFRRHDFRNQAAAFKIAYDAAGNVTTNLPRQAAERMIRKDRFRASFPSRFEDLFGLDGLDGDAAGSFSRDATTLAVTASDFANFGDAGSDDGALAAVIRNLIDNPAPGSGNFFTPDSHDPTTESSELLYLALTRGTTYGVPLDSLDNIEADHLRDTDEDGLIEILDDWGHPIRFYNWPTSLMRAGPGFDQFDPGAANVLVDDVPPGAVDWTDTTDYTSPLKQDPDDPFGELAFYFNTYGLGTGPDPMAGFGQTNSTDYTTDLARNDVSVTTFNTYHLSNTWNQPLLVSCGPNEELGLGEPNATDATRFAFADLDGSGAIDTAEIEALGDNITNRQQAGRN